MGRTHEALELADMEYHRRELALYRTGHLMEKLHAMAVAPLSAIDRVAEVRMLLEDRSIPLDHVISQIAELQREISLEGEAEFARFTKEADPVEQELLKRLQELRDIRDRAQLVCGFVTTMFRPGSMPSDGPRRIVARDPGPEPAPGPFAEAADPLAPPFEPHSDGEV